MNAGLTVFLKARQAIAWLVLLAWTSVGGPSGAAEPFVVIVNAASPLAAMSSDEVARAFAAKTSRWPAGVEVVAVDLDARSALRRPPRDVSPFLF